jgi:pyrroline-5-carboxylate reductase
MGVAILSGVLSSLESRLASPHDPNGPATREPASGISTPTASMFLDAPDETLPSRFIATVGREETGRKLRKTFAALGGRGESVQIRAGKGNIDAVKEADVVLIWYHDTPLYLRSDQLTLQLKTSDRSANLRRGRYD